MSDGLFSVADACGCQKWNCPLCKIEAKVLARHDDPATSKQAAKLAQRETILNLLTDQFRLAGMGGLTAEEAAVGAGYTAADGAWKRVSDLLNMAVLTDTGVTRKGSSGRQQRVLRYVQQ